MASNIVVADLTDGNPNVYWELGVRHSFKHGTITIAEAGTKLPFDVNSQGTLFYSDDRFQNEEFRKDFKLAIEDCITRPDHPDSHVLESISGRGSLFELVHREEAARRLKALFSEAKANRVIWGEVLKTCEKNQADPGKRTLVTNRFRGSSLELLATARYLDESDKFYDTIETYFARLARLNSQLHAWRARPDRVEEWFLNVRTATEHDVKAIGRALRRASDSLDKRV